ncbi:MAG: hypothetical protein KGS72_21505 [Cyanobacteria bacterium REEB67]|nr:hypothetical protein [Cyanobacteria bacterium REEB67]
MSASQVVQNAFLATWRVAVSEAAQEVSAIRHKAAEAAQVDSLTEAKAELESALQAAENQKAVLTAKCDQLLEQMFKLEQSRDEAVKEAAQLKGQVELPKSQNTEILDRLSDRDKPKK